MTKIIINNIESEVPLGLVLGDILYDIAECGEQCLYLNCEGEIDISVLKGDSIVIYGGEKFIIGKPGAIDDNPLLRNPVCPEFNGKKEGLSFPKSKNLGKDIKFNDDKFPEGRLFVDLPDAVDEEILDDMCIIVQSQDSYFVIPSSQDTSDGSVDIEECVKHERRIPKGRKYCIRIDGNKYVSDTTVVTGAIILGLVGKAVNEWSLNQKLKGGERSAISPDESVDLSVCGVERFETVRNTQSQGNG